MVRLVAAIACALIMAAPRAEAQALFANPFASAAEYRSTRGETADAAYRLRYEVSRSELGRDAVVSELSIYVAPDWSLVREGVRTTLRDFKLNRTFALETDRFTSQNGLADLGSWSGKIVLICNRSWRDWVCGLKCLTIATPSPNSASPFPAPPPLLPHCANAAAALGSCAPIARSAASYSGKAHRHQRRSGRRCFKK